MRRRHFGLQKTTGHQRNTGDGINSGRDFCSVEFDVASMAVWALENATRDGTSGLGDGGSSAPRTPDIEADVCWLLHGTRQFDNPTTSILVCRAQWAGPLARPCVNAGVLSGW